MRQHEKLEKDRLSKARLKRNVHLKLKMVRPLSPEEAKKFIRAVADHLSNLPNASHAFRFVAFAIKRFLRAPDKRNLSKELGLIYPAGKPLTFKKRTSDMDTARKIDALIRADQTWGQIEAKLEMDKRTLQRIYDRHSERFRKEEKSAPLDRAVREVLRERPTSS